MTSGLGALQSIVGRLKKKVPGKKNVSIMYTHQDGSIDWYPPDQINPSGVLIVPEPFPSTPEGQNKWEIFCTDEDQKNSSSSSSTNSSK